MNQFRPKIHTIDQKNCHVSENAGGGEEQKGAAPLPRPKRIFEIEVSESLGCNLPAFKRVKYSKKITTSPHHLIYVD
jgi:hypothetical protein